MMPVHVEPETRTEPWPTTPMVWHEYANLFPLLEGEAFWSLVEDVRANGVHEPIVMFEGKVLDGRNRYLAARECGQPYPLVEYTGSDALAYVISLNLKRRHLNESQRAMVAGKIAKLPHGGDRRSDQAANLPVESPTQAQAAQMLNVSERGVRLARSVHEHGAPELVAQVEAGEISVSAAAEVARLPEAAQVEIAESGPAAVKAAAREVREARKAKPSDTEPAAAPIAEDKERRKIARLAPEAMVDEILGLRADLVDAKAKIAAVTAERDDLKSKLKEATSGDMGRALGNAQRRADTATGRMNEFMAQVKRLEYRLKKAEARVKELEEMEVVPA